MNNDNYYHYSFEIKKDLHFESLFKKLNMWFFKIALHLIFSVYNLKILII